MIPVGTVGGAAGSGFGMTKGDVARRLRHLCNAVAPKAGGKREQDLRANMLSEIR